MRSETIAANARRRGRLWAGVVKPGIQLVELQSVSIERRPAWLATSSWGLPKMKNTFQKFLLASASFAFVSPLVMATPSFAQSTATTQIESVTVSANATGTGVIVPLVVPKERCTTA